MYKIEGFYTATEIRFWVYFPMKIPSLTSLNEFNIEKVTSPSEGCLSQIDRFPSETPSVVRQVNRTPCPLPTITLERSISF